jgi:hypothetical protein
VKSFTPPCAPLHDVLLNFRPKATGICDHGLKTKKLSAKIHLPSLRVVSLRYSVTLVEVDKHRYLYQYFHICIFCIYIRIYKIIKFKLSINFTLW